MSPIRLGTQGWTYDSWVGPFYPDGTRAPEYLSLYARAFVIAENSAAADRQSLTLVVADLWTCTQIVKRTVIEQLNAETTKLLVDLLFRQGDRAPIRSIAAADGSLLSAEDLAAIDAALSSS